jgi:hypothetical protein
MGFGRVSCTCGTLNKPCTRGTVKAVWLYHLVSLGMTLEDAGLLDLSNFHPVPSAPEDREIFIARARLVTRILDDLLQSTSSGSLNRHEIIALQVALAALVCLQEEGPNVDELRKDTQFVDWLAEALGASIMDVHWGIGGIGGVLSWQPDARRLFVLARELLSEQGAAIYLPTDWALSLAHPAFA